MVNASALLLERFHLRFKVARVVTFGLKFSLELLHQPLQALYFHFELDELVSIPIRRL
jgi:hypothetical protein